MDVSFLDIISLDRFKEYYPLYITILSGFMIVIAILDFTIPEKIFSIWKAWSNSRWFRLHGLAVMIGGLPLTQFCGSISGYLMFAIGVFIVMSGPFILIYPEKFSNIFDGSSEEMNELERKYLMYADGVMRIIGALIFLYTIFFVK